MGFFIANVNKDIVGYFIANVNKDIVGYFIANRKLFYYELQCL